VKELYNAIAAFASRHWEERKRVGLPVDPVSMTQHYVLALHREADELLDEVPWKSHRKYEEAGVIRDNLLEETADLIFFSWSNAARWGATYEELLEAMRTKLAVIEYRWHAEKVGTLVDKVALVDLDGVLCDWETPFLDFAIAGNPLLIGLRNTKVSDFQIANPVLYKQLKHAWRQSGQKRHLPRNDENVRAVQALEEAGYDIVIMSNRPAQRYSRILGDTLFWLNRNDVPFKRVVFTDDKPLKVALSDFADTIAFAVDDDWRNIQGLRELGIKTYQPGADIVGMLDIPEVKEAIRAARESNPN